MEIAILIAFQKKRKTFQKEIDLLKTYFYRFHINIEKVGGIMQKSIHLLHWVLFLMTFVSKRLFISAICKFLLLAFWFVCFSTLIKHENRRKKELSCKLVTSKCLVDIVSTLYIPVNRRFSVNFRVAQKFRMISNTMNDSVVQALLECIHCLNCCCYGYVA